MTLPSKLPGPVAAPVSLGDLRLAVSELSQRASADVGATRAAFASGQPPLQTVGSGSVSNYISGFAAGDIGRGIVGSTAQLGVMTSIGGNVVSPPRAELDLVEIDDSPHVGVLDSFFTRVVVSVPSADLDRIAYVRIFRSSDGRIDVPRPSFSAMRQVPPGVRRKGGDPIAVAAFQVDRLGVGNQLVGFVRDDGFVPTRTVLAPTNPRPPVPPPNTNRIGSPTALLTVVGADRSVVESIPQYITNRSIGGIVPPDLALSVGRRSGLNILGGDTVAQGKGIVEIGNAAGFTEVARLALGQQRAQVGDFTELEFIDASVIYGSAYTYYAITVDENGLSGLRSRMVRAEISRTTPPDPPSVLYSVVTGRPRFSISCAGDFVDHVEVYRRGGVTPGQVTLLGNGVSMIGTSSPSVTDSGFVHIGDLGLGAHRSVTFIDRDAVEGQDLDYRFYTVDSFGLKSQTPFSCSLKIADHGERIPLRLPTVTAEQGQGGRNITVSVISDDPRTSQFVICRRELVGRETCLRAPGAPEHFTLGRVDAKRARSRVSPTYDRTSKRLWNGVVWSTGGSGTFTDTAVEFDRIYQYSARSVDVRGNMTRDITCTPVHVAVKPVIDAPTAVSASLTVDEQSGSPASVNITWRAGVADFRADELIGDQDVLAATSQRSVYQVERRLRGRFSWDAMPAVTGTSFSDLVSSDVAPKFRPQYAQVGAEYDYRVIAMQSGAFVSTHTDPVRIAVLPIVSPPDVLFVRSTPTSIRPVHIVVSWRYEGAFVDLWEVQRAVTNKIFGGKISSLRSREAQGLEYTTVARVTREASRGHGISGDPPPFDSKVIIGNRFYVDRDVSLANSYFYRVRAVDAIGRTSDWTFGGIAMVDSPFDRKFLSALSDDEKAELANDPRPILNWRAGE